MSIKELSRTYLVVSSVGVGICLNACSGGLFSKKSGSGSAAKEIAPVSNPNPVKFESLKDVENFFDNRTNPYLSMYIDYDSDEASEDLLYMMSDSLGAPLSDFDLTSEKDALLVGQSAMQHYTHGDMTAMALVMMDKKPNLGVNPEEFASTDLEIFVETLGDFEDNLASSGSLEPYLEDDVNNFIDPGNQSVFLPPQAVFAEIEDVAAVDSTPDSSEISDPNPQGVSQSEESVFSNAFETIPSEQGLPGTQMESAGAAGLSLDLENTLPTNQTLAKIVEDDINEFQSNFGSLSYVDPSDPSVTENPKTQTLPDGSIRYTFYRENETAVVVSKPDGSSETAYAGAKGDFAISLAGPTQKQGMNVVASFYSDPKTGEVDAKLGIHHPLGAYALADDQKTKVQELDGNLWLFVLDEAGRKVAEFNCGESKGKASSSDLADCVLEGELEDLSTDEEKQENGAPE